MSGPEKENARELLELYRGELWLGSVTACAHTYRVSLCRCRGLVSGLVSP
jgi:hypothetical protein